MTPQRGHLVGDRLGRVGGRRVDRPPKLLDDGTAVIGQLGQVLVHGRGSGHAISSSCRAQVHCDSPRVECRGKGLEDGDLTVLIEICHVQIPDDHVDPEGGGSCHVVDDGCDRAGERVARLVGVEPPPG